MPHSYYCDMCQLACIILWLYFFFKRLNAWLRARLYIYACFICRAYMLHLSLRYNVLACSNYFLAYTFPKIECMIACTGIICLRYTFVTLASLWYVLAHNLTLFYNLYLLIGIVEYTLVCYDLKEMFITLCICYIL